VRIVPLLTLTLTLVTRPLHASRASGTRAWDVTSHADVHIVAPGRPRARSSRPAGHVQAHIEYEPQALGARVRYQRATIVFETRATRSGSPPRTRVASA